MTIKTATLEDVNDLSFLFDDYRVFYKKSPDRSNVVKFLTDRINNKESVIYLALDKENILAGFVQLYPLFSSTRMKRLWLLNDLFVLPAQRGKGISKALINACKDLSIQTNACGLMLETAKDNNIGNQLYPRCGFSLDLDHNYYYWNPETN
jgi:GNAT superfamily N-acetyltransferase